MNFDGSGVSLKLIRGGLSGLTDAGGKTFSDVQGFKWTTVKLTEAAQLLDSEGKPKGTMPKGTIVRVYTFQKGSNTSPIKVGNSTYVFVEMAPKSGEYWSSYAAGLPPVDLDAWKADGSVDSRCGWVLANTDSSQLTDNELAEVGGGGRADTPYSDEPGKKVTPGSDPATDPAVDPTKGTESGFPWLLAAAAVIGWQVSVPVGLGVAAIALVKKNV